MKKIKILDCTLRDGGYCNQWNFGFSNIKKILFGLHSSKIEIIECGLLSQSIEYNRNCSRFDNLDDIKLFLENKSLTSMHVCLLNYGDYDVDSLPECEETPIDGIRVAFHKDDYKDALLQCEKIKNKGYKVFIQPMVSLSYSDSEFLTLIERVNQISPYAFYIVDSFGTMKKKELLHLFYMVERNLNEISIIGFHSHNNMQLSFSNAQTLVETMSNRDIIIDTSILGMGRGSGNLNTELLTEYLNENIDSHYIQKPLLTLIDEVINFFYMKNHWGFSLPNYLSAKYNIHPNYAMYLSEKNTLTVEQLDEMFSMIDEQKKFRFDKEYIENLYIKYMSIGEVNEIHLLHFKEKIEDKEILLIAPGKSCYSEKDKIIEYSKKKDVISISINFDYPQYDVDYIFLSNSRRFKELVNTKKEKTITTSNIFDEKAYLKVEYKKLLNDVELIKDNAGMMLIKFLMMFNIKKIIIAGMDGYSHDTEENYASPDMEFKTSNLKFDSMNLGIRFLLEEYGKKLQIDFLTERKYI